MATTVDNVLGEALKLGPDERARIVAGLLASLEPDVPSDRRTEAEWIDEIERRARAAIAGKPGAPWATDTGAGISGDGNDPCGRT